LKNGESDLRKERIGFAMCGSFCTHGEVLRALERLAEEYETIIPIVSEISGDADTRFGTAEALLEKVEQITGRKPLRTITEVEPIGPKGLLDLLVIAPATGNTLAKLAAGITDTAVTMATKAHLRNGRPVVVAIASNDGLGAGAKNIGELLVRKNYYFVPFGQDAAFAKPTSLIADFGKLTETVDAALRGEQIQPILRIE
jgi:dipicolinate synthase subunit B